MIELVSYLQGAHSVTYRAELPMGLPEALTLLIVMLPLAAMPSASVALVVARSASAGRRSGAAAALGIVVGDLLFIAMALLGMTLLAGWLGTLFSLLKYAGGAYLIFLGISLLSSKPLLTIPRSAIPSTSLLTDFLAGLALTLGDIKAILFYASLFPILVDMENIGVTDIALITLITAVTVGGVKMVYVVLATHIVDRLRGGLASEVPRKLGGVLLIGCGSALIAKA